MSNVLKYFKLSIQEITNYSYEQNKEYGYLLIVIYYCDDFDCVLNKKKSLQKKTFSLRITVFSGRQTPPEYEQDHLKLVENPNTSHTGQYKSSVF